MGAGEADIGHHRRLPVVASVDIDPEALPGLGVGPVGSHQEARRNGADTALIRDPGLDAVRMGGDRLEARRTQEGKPLAVGSRTKRPLKGAAQRAGDDHVAECRHTERRGLEARNPEVPLVRDVDAADGRGLSGDLRPDVQSRQDPLGRGRECETAVVKARRVHYFPAHRLHHRDAHGQIGKRTGEARPHEPASDDQTVAVKRRGHRPPLCCSYGPCSCALRSPRPSWVHRRSRPRGRPW